jgi:hypothetical protein
MSRKSSSESGSLFSELIVCHQVEIHEHAPVWDLAGGARLAVQPVEDLLRGTQPVRVVGDVFHMRRGVVADHHATLCSQAVGVHGTQVVFELLGDLLNQFDLSRPSWSAAERSCGCCLFG